MSTRETVVAVIGAGYWGPNLVRNFSLLDGVQEFGALDVGEPAPLWPGDQISYISDKLGRFGVTHVPKGKKLAATTP